MKSSGEMFAGHRVVSALSGDEAQEALGRVFLPVELRAATTTAGVDLRLNAMELGQITVGFMSFRGAVRIQTAEPANYHVDIPSRSRSTMRAERGPRVRASTSTAGIFMPGRPVELACEEQFAQVALMIPRTHLQREVEQLLDAVDLPPVRFETELDLAGAGGRMILHSLRLIDEASRHSQGLLTHPLAARHLEQVLLHSLLFAQPHNHSAAMRAGALPAGNTTVSRAVSLLQDDPARPWTVSQLAHENATSARSLHLAFRDGLGTTPMAYLQRIRLERVRDELLTGEPSSLTITGVAAKWGFVHLGRFAAAYARRFDELPSETLRRRSRARPPRPGRGSEGRAG